jgi:mono/diheme cytochrome c family protein
MKKLVITLFVIGISGIYLFAEMPNRPVSKASIARGRKIYRTYCLSCHQQDGSGVYQMYPPSQRSPYVKGKSSTLIKILVNGRTEGVEINGDTYNNAMPPFGNTLKDQQIADVLTYVRNNFGNKASQVYSLQVKKIRSQLK